MLEIIRLVLVGIVIGMANVIPGVSGGTLAVVFNIYDKFVNAITLNLKKIWANRRFVIPLLFGMALGILILSKVITKVYENFPFQTNCFFTGLILGSIPLLFSLILKKHFATEDGFQSSSSKEKYFKFTRIIGIVICAISGFSILLLFNHLETSFTEGISQNMILPDLSFTLTFRLFIAGLLGAVAMIIPGISGSLLMLMMGVYTIIISAIPSLFAKDTMLHSFLLLLPNGLGVIVGLLCGAKFISFLLKKLPHQTYAVIFGLICGSVLVVLPSFSEFLSFGRILSGIVCILFGAALSYFSSKFDSAENLSEKDSKEKSAEKKLKENTSLEKTFSEQN